MESDWRKMPSTEEQTLELLKLVRDMMQYLNRGQAFDLIEKMSAKSSYDLLKVDLKKKNRSWKWKEDLK